MLNVICAATWAATESGVTCLSHSAVIVMVVVPSMHDLAGHYTGKVPLLNLFC